MNLTTKRRIAKEILYFFTGVIIILLFWGIILIQNNYYQNKVVTCKNEINHLQTQINLTILHPDKLKKLFANVKIMNESGSSNEDIVDMMNAFEKRFGKKITLSERIKLEKLRKNEKIETNKLKEISLKIFNEDDIFTNIKISSILILALLYPIRFIFILIKWAIKILKLKTN